MFSNSVNILLKQGYDVEAGLDYLSNNLVTVYKLEALLKYNEQQRLGLFYDA